MGTLHQNLGNFGDNRVKLVEVRPILSEVWPSESVFWQFVIYGNIRKKYREPVR